MYKVRKKNEFKVVDLYVIYNLKEYSKEIEKLIEMTVKDHDCVICDSGAKFGVRDIHFRGQRCKLRPMLAQLYKYITTLEGEVD